MTNGETAYEAYREHSGGKSLVSGHPIPEWGKLPGDIQAAWDASARAVGARQQAVTKQLADQVAEMRHAQTEYFRLRSQSVLQHAKQLEAKVDGTLRSVLAGEQQAELF